MRDRLLKFAARIDADRALLPVMGFCLLLSALLCLSLATEMHQYYWLAQSFLEGRLDIPADRVSGPFVDAVLFGGRIYWAPGPLPALLMVPFVGWLSPYALLPLLHLSLTGLTLWAAYSAARRSGQNRVVSCWLSLALLLSSVFVGVLALGTPWNLASLLTACLLTLAVREHLGQGRPAVLGLLIAAAAASRLTAAAALLLFLPLAVRRARGRREMLHDVSLLVAPLVVTVVLLALYNWLRFADPFETGYSLHFLVPGPERVRLEANGLFSPASVIRNFYYYFLALPELRGWLPVASGHGLSLFLVSPIFLWTFLVRRHSIEALGVLAVTVAQLAVFLSYFSSGFVQFGPRYALDFLPLWFLLLLRVFAERGFLVRHRALVLGSAAANIVGFAVFSVMPL